MPTIKKYTSNASTRLTEMQKKDLLLLASQNNCHYSDLLRECIECLLKNKTCKVRRKYHFHK